MALFSSTQPSLRARVLARFPAQVRAGTGMTITKSGGVYTFSSLATGRTQLEADTTFYVRTGGSDSSGHTGLSNTDGDAFASVTYAYTRIRTGYDFAGFDATIQVQNASWTDAPWIIGERAISFGHNPRPAANNYSWAGGGRLIIDGGGGLLTGQDDGIFVQTVGYNVKVQNIGITAGLAGANAGNCINAFGFGQLEIGDGVDFGPVGGVHVFACESAFAFCETPTSYTISGGAVFGGAGAHITAETPGARVIWEPSTVTISNAPTFLAFAFASDGGAIQHFGTTSWVNSGTVTGQRALAITGGMILNPDDFPGSTAAGAIDGWLDDLTFTNPSLVHGSYSAVGLPPATRRGQMIFVTDETGGAVMAFSDGTNWRRVTDRAIVA